MSAPLGWGRGPVLLLGAGGQVGTELEARLAGHTQFFAPRREELDLSDAASLRRIIQEVKPAWIFNAAAYTAVDRAESEPDLAYAINAEAVRVIGEAAALTGAAVVHFSTDYVFDGTACTPRCESDPTAPLGVYGASKLAGERALRASGAACFIFRTSWVYSTHGKNFLLTMLRLAAEREEIRVVADQVGAPTSARDLAHLVHHAVSRVERALTRDQDREQLSQAMAQWGGLYHACNAGETSWFGFAETLLRLAHENGHLGKVPRLTPIATKDYPTPARRPADSRMCCTLLEQRLGYRMPAWEDSLKLAIEALVREAAAREAAAEVAPSAAMP